jgi:hypothetical protein
MWGLCKTEVARSKKKNMLCNAFDDGGSFSGSFGGWIEEHSLS